MTTARHMGRWRVIRWVGGVTITGASVFGFAAVVFLLWFWFDHTE